MARAKKCEVEFNPWPPFVDVFSSVILVLLLFILVTIVNVAYYMQFNAKSNSQAESKSPVESLQSGVDMQDLITFDKVEKVAQDAAGKDALFSGGSSDGNALTVEKPKDELHGQIASKSKGQLLVSYDGKEIFNTAKVKKDIKAFLKAEQAKNPDAKFEISVAQPTKILGRTIPKQISLGRALNVKNFLKKEDVKLSHIKLNMQKNRDKKFGYGYVKINVIK